MGVQSGAGTLLAVFWVCCPQSSVHLQPAWSAMPTLLIPALLSAGFCHGSLKPASSPAIAIAAAAMVSVDTEGLRGPSPAVPPYHFLTWAPITMPLRTVSFSGRLLAGGRGSLPCHWPRPPSQLTPGLGTSGGQASSVLGSAVCWAGVPEVCGLPDAPRCPEPSVVPWLMLGSRWQK